MLIWNRDMSCCPINLVEKTCKRGRFLDKKWPLFIMYRL